MSPLLILWALVGCKDGGWPFGSDTGGGIFNNDRDDDSAAVEDDTGEGPRPEDCDEARATTAPGGPDCLSGVLSCGDTLEATTEGGSTQLDGGLYEDGYCFVPFEDYEGPERAYELLVPPETLVTLIADFSCQDMALVAALWSDEDTCPYEGAGLYVCEGKSVSSGAEVLILPDDAEARYVVVVDSPAGQEGNFSLEVVCESR